MPDTSNTLTLKVERMTYGPDAIAHRDDGKTVFVGGAIAGDTVEAEIVEDGPRFCRANVTRVVEPSPNRIKPAWSLAPALDGCPWAVMARPAQLEAKRANVVDALTRIGHFSPDVAEKLVEPCEAPSDGWGYRNKVELGFARKGQHAVVGMHMASSLTPQMAFQLAQEGARNRGKSNRKGHGKKQVGLPFQSVQGIMKVDDCPLLDEPYRGLVRSVGGAIGFLSGSSNLNFERIGIRASSRTKQVEVALWTAPGPFPRAQAARVITDATQGAVTSIVRVMTKGPSKARKIAGVETLDGRGYWKERIGGEHMYLSAPSFFQVNTAGAERLQELVLEALDPQPEDEAMDLYSGAGTFTLPLARRTDWVSAVESYGPAVRDLRRNLEESRIDNVDPIGGDADREFPDTDADIIVVDPPRAGLAADVVKKLSDQPARAIAYVSCDPATLARDLARFEQAGTFRPVRITPVDLFPQTFHVECVVLLTRQTQQKDM